MSGRDTVFQQGSLLIFSALKQGIPPFLLKQICVRLSDNDILWQEGIFWEKEVFPIFSGFRTGRETADGFPELFRCILQEPGTAGQMSDELQVSRMKKVDL
ncbi:MAG TPA: hypothetical protein O0W82_07440 [Methanocorpusculum sp.]|nr:hypothetical protein [Methanocorpusculum sp.]